MGYDAWGNVRVRGDLKTDIGYTAQREDVGINVMFYRARFYSPYLNRWISPDTIVPQPGNPQDLNRYSYTRNNPLKYVDPSGHRPCEGFECITPGNLHSILASLGPSTSFRQPLTDLDTRVNQGYNAATHPGIDYDDMPNPVIRASANGVVIVADACLAQDCVGQGQAGVARRRTGPAYNGGYGNVMVIEYPYDTLPDLVVDDIGLQEGQSLYMLYAHLQDAPTLRPGNTVRPGQIIGEVGSTGHSTGPHLHFETRIGAKGSLPFGDMCGVACAPTRNDSYPRFDAWYNSGRFRHFDPATLRYYTARELRTMQP